MPASRIRRNQMSSSGGSHCPWIGRSTAALTPSALSHRILAPRSLPGGVPVVITIWVTPSSSTAALATSPSCCGRLALDGAAGGERLADGAELAGLGAALVADAGLQNRRRQHVAAVQRGDLGIGNAVGGRALVEARPQLEFHLADHRAVAADLAAAERIRLVDDDRGFRTPARCAPGSSRSRRRWSSACDRRARRRRDGCRRRPWDQRDELRRIATR